jgi:excisionase family DNA binding protein
MSQIAQHDRGDSAGLKPLTVTVATAKKISGLGNTTVWGLIKQGKLEAVRIGRRTLVTFRSLEALLAPAHTERDDEI